MAVKVSANQRFKVDFPHFRTREPIPHYFVFDSVQAYYERTEASDAVAASVKAAAERGNTMYFAVPEASVIALHHEKKDAPLNLAFEDKIIFDGKLFRIEQAANNNIELQAV